MHLFWCMHLLWLVMLLHGVRLGSGCADYIDTIQIHDLEFAPNLDIIVEQAHILESDLFGEYTP